MYILSPYLYSINELAELTEWGYSAEYLEAVHAQAAEVHGLGLYTSLNTNPLIKPEQVTFG